MKRRKTSVQPYQTPCTVRGVLRDMLENRAWWDEDACAILREFAADATVWDKDVGSAAQWLGAVFPQKHAEIMAAHVEIVQQRLETTTAAHRAIDACVDLWVLRADDAARFLPLYPEGEYEARLIQALSALANIAAYVDDPEDDEVPEGVLSMKAHLDYLPFDDWESALRLPRLTYWQAVLAQHQSRHQTRATSS